jgi:threonine dehydrogenase-like Zn-dependent dehydrogenase
MVASPNSAPILRVCITLIVENKWLILAGKVFKIHNLSDVDATLLEPASCAAHGLDKIAPKLGSSVLMFGAGPTGVSSLAA